MKIIYAKFTLKIRLSIWFERVFMNVCNVLVYTLSILSVALCNIQIKLNTLLFNFIIWWQFKYSLCFAYQTKYIYIHLLFVVGKLNYTIITVDVHIYVPRRIIHVKTHQIVKFVFPIIYCIVFHTFFILRICPPKWN